MKKLLSLYVFAVLSLSAFAQTDIVVGYKSIFGHESTVWNGATMYMDDPNCYNYILRTSYDTIIDSLNYKKIECYRLIYSTGSEWRKPSLDFFLREDSTNGRIWLHLQDNSIIPDTNLIMDMTLEIGDSILLPTPKPYNCDLLNYWFHVTNITYCDSTKTIHLKNKYNDCIDFVEGTGCSNLFDFVFAFQVESRLICCHKDGELIYHNAIPDYPDEGCIIPPYTGIGNCDDKVSVSVFPNPCTDWIEVNGENIQSASLCDIKGNVVMADIEVPSRISMADIPSGVYFLRVVQDNMVSSRSVIKK